MRITSRGQQVQAGKGPARRGAQFSAEDLSGVISSFQQGDTAEQPWLEGLNLIHGQLRASWVALMLRPASAGNDPWMIVSAEPLGLASESPQVLGRDIPPRGAFRELPSGSLEVVESAGPFGAMHVIGADLRVGDGFQPRLRIARTARAGAFTESERCYAETLLPHLRRAMCAASTDFNRVQDLRLLNTAVESLALGLVVLNESGEVIRTNDCADRVLRAGRAVRLVRSRLQCLDAYEDRKLAALLRLALSSRQQEQPAAFKRVLALRPEGGAWLSILVRPLAPNPLVRGPLAPAVALFIRSPEHDHEVPLKVIQDLFGLTTTEAVLALEMANGSSMDEAAEAMGIRRNTARTHLRAIFAKVGVRRQTMLMRVILNSVATMV